MLGIYVPAQLVGAIAGLLLSELLTDSILERFVITDAVHGWRVFAN